MKQQKLRVMMADDFDEELNTLSACTILLKKLTFDQQWRVLNYLLIRCFGRSWALSRPASDEKKS